MFAYRPTGSWVLLAPLSYLCIRLTDFVETYFYVPCLRIDFCKAFDIVNCSILASKLIGLGLPSCILHSAHVLLPPTKIMCIKLHCLHCGFAFWHCHCDLHKHSVFARNRDTAVPAEGNGDLQTLICVLVARSRRCLTLSNPVPWQNWMVAYLGYTLQTKTLFRGWLVMVHDTHTRRRRSVM